MRKDIDDTTNALNMFATTMGENDDQLWTLRDTHATYLEPSQP